MAYAWPALVTLVAVLFYFVTIANVGRARDRYGIKAPAVTGHPDFDRVHRVEESTLEQLVLFLPSLWVCAVFLSPAGASALGAIWLLGRVLYAVGYYRSASKRGLGLIITVAAFALLWFGALWGIAGALLAE